MGGIFGFGRERFLGFGFGTVFGGWNFDGGWGRRHCDDRRRRWWDRGWGCDGGWNW
jgi:hypothetical protein